jgi:hypothetical protein
MNMRIASSHSIRRAAALVMISFCAAASGVGVSAPAPVGANSPSVCAMLSPSDLRAWWGKDMAVRPATDLPQAAACDWGATDGGGGLLTVRIVPPSYYTEPKLGKGFKRLTGIGDKAYVAPQLGGWVAGAVKGKLAVVIQVDGGKSTEATAVTVLKTLVRKI